MRILWAATTLEVGDEGHRRHPGSEGWVHLADVGFSPAGHAALTYAWSLSGSLAGGGQWILLEKRDGRWTIVKQEQNWVS